VKGSYRTMSQLTVTVVNGTVVSGVESADLARRYPQCVPRPQARQPQSRVTLALGLALGAWLDSVIPDPQRGHPVAVFGTAAGAVERQFWGDDRPRGTAFALAAVGLPIAASRLVERRTRGLGTIFVVAVTTWAVLGARSLRTEAETIDAQLASGDLADARLQLTHLVGRDPSRLEAAEISRAAVESVAENTCDALVAPLFWGAIAGLPGLVGYRAINTLDAMVGYRSPRYENFGWASARLDDVANFVPARVTAGLVALVAGSVGGSPSEVLRIVRRDGRRHPSPNSGMSESAFAAALGRRLGGRNDYGGRIEERPALGDGPAVEAADLGRAARLSAAVALAAGVGAVALALVSRPARGRS
jgi:adenosylcobinamide-phosphate synthase